MRARPEPTQLEHLSDALLLVFPVNVRLDWKVIAIYKHSSLFGLVNSNKGKKFYNIDTWWPSTFSEAVTTASLLTPDGGKFVAWPSSTAGRTSVSRFHLLRFKNFKTLKI